MYYSYSQKYPNTSSLHAYTVVPTNTTTLKQLSLRTEYRAHGHKTYSWAPRLILASTQPGNFCITQLEFSSVSADFCLEIIITEKYISEDIKEYVS